MQCMFAKSLCWHRDSSWLSSVTLPRIHVTSSKLNTFKGTKYDAIYSCDAPRAVDDEDM